MDNIIISNQNNFDKILGNIISGGVENFHVVADFDRTLTKAFVNGKPMPAIISVLRNENYLSKEYSEKATALANKYHPIEEDLNMSISEKKKYMEEWWGKHFELLIKSGLNKKNLERVINEGKVEFRDGACEFLDLLHEKNIPLVILSSSGVGDLIPMYFEKHGKLYNNIDIIANLYKWDKNGNASGMHNSIIHVFNKDETSVKSHLQIYEKIKNRKNVLLLGDSLGDLGMVSGFDYENLLKVGFLNDKIIENLEEYKKNFDIVITDDFNMNYVNDIIKKI
jgi:cytosolic 5'-nucleotidase 3